MSEQALFFPKLNDYREVKWNDIKAGDHFRYSCQGYGDQKDTRKLVYAICKENDGLRIDAKAYKPREEWGRNSWYLEKDSPSKKFKFYKKNLEKN